MTERTTSRLALGAWAVMVTLTVTGAVTQLLTRDTEVASSFAFRGSDIILSLSLGSVGVLIASRRRENPIGWILLAVALVASIGYAGAQYGMLSVVRHGSRLPLTSFAAWLQNWLWVPLIGGVLYSIVLFPDGKPPTPRWRPFLRWLVPVAFTVFAAAIAFFDGPLQGYPRNYRNPYTLPNGLIDGLTAIGGLLFIATIVLTVIAVVRRFRRSSGTTREQLKWLVLAAAGVALTMGVGMPAFLAQGTQGQDTLLVRILAGLVVVAIIGIPVSMGIAILRHRLYDIDLVINKTVVFGALAAAITAVYVAIVVGIGAAVGSTGRPNVGLSVAATAAVAVLFQPLRSWARRVANRLVYGKRATPHDVLSVLGERISDAYSLDDVLPRLAQLVTEATAASSAEVWLRVGDEMRPTAAWPHEPANANVRVPSDGEDPVIPGAEHTFPARHQGELLGAVAVRTPSNETLTTADVRLLADLASHAGLVLRNVRLIEELRASRQRLVSAQDVERRKIERNLHDGAQQHLVALSINLGLAQSLFDSDPAQAREMLAQLKSDASDALENLRDLARGIYPPLLADRGLSAALTSHAAKAPVPTKVEAGEVARYPMEVEAAIYFCVLEALQNVAKYAGASSAVVRLAEDNGHVTFAVTDDGAGFDVARAARGAGLTNMTDRLEALGGRLEVSSKPGAGTTIRGWVSSTPAS
jgi:signal transduction histidine kinase